MLAFAHDVAVIIVVCVVGVAVCGVVSDDTGAAGSVVDIDRGIWR